MIQGSDVMDQETKRSIILEHYQHPKNKGLIDDDTYIICVCRDVSYVSNMRKRLHQMFVYTFIILLFASGVISWLMDTAMGTFAWSYLGFERSVTVDIHVNYLETVKAGDEIIITSRLAHAGRRTVNVNGQAAVDGMLCATADAIFYKIG